MRHTATACPPQAAESVPELIPFDAHAKKTLELTFREALWMNHSHVGTEHILLALLELEDGTGILAGLGVDKPTSESFIATSSAAPPEPQSADLATSGAEPVTSHGAR